MIRVVCWQDFIGDVVYGGAKSADRRFTTFDVDIPQLEAWLRAAQEYQPRGVAGIELLPAKETP